jgi:hypothetical protein
MQTFPHTSHLEQAAAEKQGNVDAATVLASKQEHVYTEIARLRMPLMVTGVQ